MAKQHNPQMSRSEIARMANVNRADVTNYLAERLHYVTKEKQIRIKNVLEANVNQHQRIMSYLRQGRGLTRISAMLELGVGNLPARIGELRKKHDIETDMSNGYATYKLVQS